MNTRPPAVAVVVVAPLRSVFPRVLKLPAPLLARPLRLETFFLNHLHKVCGQVMALNGPEKKDAPYSRILRYENI